MKQREQALILFQKAVDDLTAAEAVLPLARVTDAMDLVKRVRAWAEGIVKP